MSFYLVSYNPPYCCIRFKSLDSAKNFYDGLVNSKVMKWVTLDKLPNELIDVDPFEFMHGYYGHNKKMDEIESWRASGYDHFDCRPASESIEKANNEIITKLLNNTDDEWWNKVYD